MSPAYDTSTWLGYLTAEASASAALTGLIFVAVSINLSSIVVSKALVARAAKAIFALMSVLASSTFALVPGQSGSMLGMELAILGSVVWLAVTWTQYVASAKNPYVTWKHRLIHMVLTQIASLQLIAAGASLWTGRGGGLYWLVGAFLGSLVVALLDGWVLLIEIQR